MFGDLKFCLTYYLSAVIILFVQFRKHSSRNCNATTYEQMVLYGIFGTIVIVIDFWN